VSGSDPGPLFSAQQKSPGETPGDFFCEGAKHSLTILWALLTALLSALLTATALLAALTSGHLILLTRLLLTATALLAALLPALASWLLSLLTRFLLTALLTALLLPTHFFVSHGAILLRGRISAGGQSPRDTVGSLSDKRAG
jgi:hypothetical protein